MEQWGADGGVTMQQWPPGVGDSVRIRATGTESVVDGIEGSGDDAVYLIGPRVALSTDLHGNVWQTSVTPLRCSLAQIEPREGAD